MTTIIIVDDDEEILAPLEQMLSAEGYVVKAFSSSLKAEGYLKGTWRILPSSTLRCLN